MSASCGINKEQEMSIQYIRMESLTICSTAQHILESIDFFCSKVYLILSLPCMDSASYVEGVGNLVRIRGETFFFMLGTQLDISFLRVVLRVGGVVVFFCKASFALFLEKCS